MDQSRIFFWTVTFYSFFICSPQFSGTHHQRGAPKVEFQQNNDGFTDQKSSGADSEPHRKRRYLTFNNDQSNIRVEMVFAVPVLAIPIGGKDSSDEVPTFPTIDINTKSILATGVIMFMLFFIIPTLVRLYFPMPSSDSSSGHGRSFTRSGREDIFQFISRFEEALKGFNVDSGQCSQKVVCWMVSNAAHRVSASKASSFDKIIDGISSFSWVQYMLEDTPYGEALTLGQNRDCDYYNNKCSITSNKLTVAANSLLNAIKKSKREESARNPSP